MEQNLKRAAGWISITQGVIYIIGFIILVGTFHHLIDEQLTVAQKVSLFLSSKALYHTWNIIVYQLFSILLIPLVVLLSYQLNASIIKRVAPVFGFIWAGFVMSSGMIANIGIEAVEKFYSSNQETAIILWQAIEVIQNSLGGGVELVGGIWVLLVSIAGLQDNVFSKPINSLGLIVGLAGIATVLPGLSFLGAVFGLLQIGWFLWLGIWLLKNGKQESEPVLATS